jgi:hypothetical protein
MNKQLVILLAVLIFGWRIAKGGSVVSAQQAWGEAQASEIRAPTACPPSVEFGCLVSGSGAWGWRVDNGSTATNTYALYGRITSTAPGSGAAAVLGQNLGTGNRGYGVVGTHAGGGIGVAGSSVTGIGVSGASLSTGAAPAVLGVHNATTGTGAGVEGRTNSTSEGATGVLGVVSSTSNVALTAGVRGINNTNGFGVYGSAKYTGVYGYGSLDSGVYGASTNAFGVRGHADSNTGVFGDSFSSYGVQGYSYSTAGVYGSSLVSYGVQGYSNPGTGVYGESLYGRGVSGFSENHYGVYGESGSSYAGYFEGDVHVQGTLTKAGGSFRIDHPLDPENQYLSHSFVESPDMMNVYNGNITTDANGDATVELPVYFQALNRDFRYQLTVIGQFSQAIVSEKVHNNQFRIKTDLPFVEVSWQVTGIRQDAWANENRIPVEEPKPEAERGTYLYPEGYGQPEERGVHYERQQRMRQMQTEAAPTPTEAPADGLPAPSEQ